jgi:hypothetical protein
MCSVFWLDLTTGQTMDVVGNGDLSLAEAVESRGVFDTWVPLVEPSTVRPHCEQQRFSLAPPHST